MRKWTGVCSRLFLLVLHREDRNNQHAGDDSAQSSPLQCPGWVFRLRFKARISFGWQNEIYPASAHWMVCVICGCNLMQRVRLQPAELVTRWSEIGGTRHAATQTATGKFGENTWSKASAASCGRRCQFELHWSDPVWRTSVFSAANSLLHFFLVLLYGDFVINSRAPSRDISTHVTVSFISFFDPRAF